MKYPMARGLSGLVLALVCVGGCGNNGHNPVDLGGSGFADLAGFHNVDPPDLSGLDFPEAFGTVYAHTGQTLYTVDPTTYDITKVGDFGAAEDMTDLAITPDNKIYTISRTSLYKVDDSTGAATVLLSNITSSNVALTFQVDGTLLAADQAGAVRIIDPSTGNVTEVGNYGTGYDTAGDLVAIADGTMFGVSTKAPSLGSTTNVLIKVNTNTAKATSVGKIGYTGVFGVAYAGGKVLAFTNMGEIIRIDPATGNGTLARTYSGMKWYGAGTSPLVPIQ
jgi:hypothetical protein